MSWVERSLLEVFRCTKLLRMIQCCVTETGLFYSCTVQLITDNFKRIWRKWSWSVLWKEQSTCLEWLSKTMKILNQNTRRAEFLKYGNKRREENQLDATECFIALIICWTYFGHLYALHQELETITVLLSHMVCNAARMKSYNKCQVALAT